MTDTTAAWINRHAHPLDPQDPLPDLPPLRDIVRDATIVALGASTRQAHELSVSAHRMVRFLVEELGFRSVALEGDDPARVGLDDYVRTGKGDPRTSLAGARAFWRTGEILDLIHWMRAYNEDHPDDPVRFAGVRPQTEPAVGMPAIERRMAEDTIWWHERTGDKIVYWGGLAHTSVALQRLGPPSSPQIFQGSGSSSPEVARYRNVGGHLRERFGTGYLSIGLTFGHGTLPFEVPAPPVDFAETALSAAGLDAFLLDLRVEGPAAVRAWLDAPARTRLIGPRYDPADDAAYHLSGGSFGGWFDAVVHHERVTPVRDL
ncbi:erythromycin esterase family protein [Nonomuraea aurantiaca]|uniref:erythromycin esterase family protein n=1 Tax=Nonomuraea aurantiaca TaxID=2878562 RepID=UPI001CD9ACF2|nr:erythromycin esterase family protein [Nonomuraea aurantiaca]MCA2222908.1 erythromycin esterase family protein [Nonomuraea aurantiaca]